MKRKAKNPNKVGLKEMFLWQSRGISSAMHVMVISYIQMYCTDALGLSPALVGTLLLTTKLFDGFTDIIAGYIVDKTNTKIGRGRPYELCIIGTWVCTLLLFSCPPGWEVPVKCVWIVVMYTAVCSIFNTFLNANTTPYMVRAFNNQEKYVSLTSYGGVMTMIGAAVVNISFPTLMGQLATSAKGWTTLILIFAVPGLLLGILRFIFIPEKYNVDVKTEKVNLREVLTVLKTNKYIYAVAVMVLMTNLVSNMGVNIYYYKYVVGNVSLYSIVAMVSMVMLPVMFIFPPLMKKMRLSTIMFIGFGLCCIGSIINWFAVGYFPALLVAALLAGVGVVPINMLMGLMVIDCADYNEYQGMARMEGTLGVIPGLGIKIGSALGSFLLGVFLQMGGYISSADDAFVTQPDSAILMLRLLMSLIPLVLYVIAMIASKCYTLDRKMPKIREELDERRKQYQA